MMQELVAMNIGKLCETRLDIIAKLVPEKLKHIAIVHMLQHDCCVDMVIFPGIDRTVQMRSQDGPASYLDLLFASQEHRE